MSSVTIRLVLGFIQVIVAYCVIFLISLFSYRDCFFTCIYRCTLACVYACTNTYIYRYKRLELINSLFNRIIDEGASLCFGGIFLDLRDKNSVGSVIYCINS